MPPMGMGVALLMAEAIGEGMASQASRFVPMALVFVGVEGAGVSLGYALLAGFLGIFPRE